MFQGAVRPNSGRVFGLGSIQRQSFKPNMRSNVSLSRNLDSELRFSRIEETVAMFKRGQDVLLRAQGIDPDTFEPLASPSASAANNEVRTSPSASVANRVPVNLGDLPGQSLPGYFDEVA